MPEEITVVLSTCQTLHSTSPMEMVHRIQPIVPKAKAASWRCEVLVRELIVWRSVLSQTCKERWVFSPEAEASDKRMEQSGF